MPYIGKQLVRGQNRELDDISSSFNGATTTFNLTVAGDSVTPGSALQLFISIGGVLQNPNTDFTVAGNQITFSTAPGSGLSFFGYLQGDAVDFNTPADDSVTTTKIANDAVTEAKVSVKNGFVPTGAVFYFVSTSVPNGYLKCNGDTIPNGSGTVQGVTADFSTLYALVGATLPDLRGEFIRGLDDGRGVDSGRTLGSTQTDQNKQHNHGGATSTETLEGELRKISETWNNNGTATGVFSKVTGLTSPGTPGSPDSSDSGGIDFDATHSHTISNDGGTESRPRNVALLACIKY